MLDRRDVVEEHVHERHDRRSELEEDRRSPDDAGQDEGERREPCGRVRPMDHEQRPAPAPRDQQPGQVRQDDQRPDVETDATQHHEQRTVDQHRPDEAGEEEGGEAGERPAGDDAHQHRAEHQVGDGREGHGDRRPGGDRELRHHAAKGRDHRAADVGPFERAQAVGQRRDADDVEDDGIEAEVRLRLPQRRGAARVDRGDRGGAHPIHLAASLRILVDIGSNGGSRSPHGKVAGGIVRASHQNSAANAYSRARSPKQAVKRSSQSACLRR